MKYLEHSRSSTRGAILPLLLLLMVPILILLAFVVDIGIVLNASRDLEQKTRNAALSGLAAFQDEYRRQAQQYQPCSECGDESIQPNCIARCAMVAAHARAEEIARTNLSIGERFSEDRLFDFTKRSSPPSGTLSTSGEFRLGVYYWLEPPECQGSGSSRPSWCPDSYPSFQTIDVNQNAEIAKANAIELRAGFPSSNPILGIFSGIVSQRSFTIQNLARAAILPRNDMFLMDLSRSMYRDNYRFYPVAAQDGVESEFAFLMRPSVNACFGSLASQVCCQSSCIIPNSPACLACTADPSCVDGSGSLIEWGSTYPLDPTLFADLYGSPPFPTLSPPEDTPPVSWQHFSTYYRAVPIPFRWDNSSRSNRCFLVDYGNDLDFSMTARPEPLFSVLDAANLGLETLRTRNMSVDRTGIIAFESDSTNLLAQNPRLLRPSPSSSLDFSSFVYATRTDPVSAGSYWSSFLSKALVPRPGSTSDIFQALREAAYLISLEPTYQIAKNSITIFTDGLQNCVYDVIPGGDWWSGWQRNGDCRNLGDKVIEGIQNLTNPDFVAELKRRQISVNVILFGQEVGPHRVIRKAISGQGCRDQIEDNASPNPALPYVDSGWDNYLAMDETQMRLEFSQRSSTQPFYAPNQLYHGLVAETRGLWLPVLPAYPATNADGDPINLYFWNELNEACADADDQAPLAGLDLELPDPANPGSTIIITDITDGAGRLRYDPLGRSVKQQMESFVDQIIQSPYVLVP